MDQKKPNKKAVTFTGSSKLSVALKNPSTYEALIKHNVPCIHCPMAQLEMDKLTLAQISQTYGIDLNKLLNDLNLASKKNTHVTARKATQPQYLRTRNNASAAKPSGTNKRKIDRENL